MSWCTSAAVPYLPSAAASSDRRGAADGSAGPPACLVAIELVNRLVPMPWVVWIWPCVAVLAHLHRGVEVVGRGSARYQFRRSISVCRAHLALLGWAVWGEVVVRLGLSGTSGGVSTCPLCTRAHDLGGLVACVC